MADFFNIGNKKFDISQLGEIRKEDIEKLGDKKLFTIFNAINSNGDHIVDASEISLFINNLKGYDKNNDGNISNKEFKQFFKANKDLFGGDNIKLNSVAEVFNMSISSYKAPEQTVSKYVFDFELKPRTEDDIKDDTIEFIYDEFKNGLSALNGFDEGILSKGYNEIKELLGSKMAKSNVMKVLYMKNETANYLRLAKEGKLTRAEYYKLQKENLISLYPGVDSMTAEQKAELTKYVDGIDERGLKTLITEAMLLPNPDSQNYGRRLKEFAKLFEVIAVEKNTTTVYQTGEFTSFSSNTEYKPHHPSEPANGEELMTFEEVFSDTYGMPYSAKRFETLEDTKNEYIMTCAAYATVDKIHDILDKQIRNAQAVFERAGSEPAIEKRSKFLLEGAIFSALRELGAETPEDQLNLLKDLSGYNNIDFKKFDNSSLADFSGNIIQVPGFTNSEQMSPANLNDLINISKRLLAKVEENKIKNYPNSPEIKGESLKNRYASFFGKESVDTLVQAYMNDQDRIVQNVRTGVELVSGAASIVGMFVCPLAALVAAGVGATAGIGVEALNEATKEEFSQEKKSELLRELATNVALFAASGVASHAGTVAKAALLAKNCPRLVACISNIGLDSTLSLISTYALTGQISLEGEGLSQALALLAGHIRAGKFAKRALSRQDIDPKKNPAFDASIANLAKNNPKLYQDFQLLRSKNLLPHSSLVDYAYNPKNSSFSKQFLDDVATMAGAVRSGVKPIDAFVPKYKSVAEAAGKRKVGEVFSVKGTNDVYYVSSKGAQKLDMDRDMYFKLFPPLKSAATKQGQIGNCYFVSGILDGCMSNPEAKALLLSKFHQRGNDITIDLGKYNFSPPGISMDKLPYSITFKNAKKHLSLYHNQGISGAQGLKLVEQAYGYKLVAEDFVSKIQQKYPNQPEVQNKLLDELKTLFINPKRKPSKELAEAMEFAYGRSNNKTGTNFLGRMALTIDGIQASRNKAIEFGGEPATNFKNFFDLDSSASKLVELGDIAGYRNNPNFVLFTCSYPADNRVKEELCLLFGLGESGKNLIAGNHAYRVADVDNVNNTVSIVNPWNTSKIVTISRNKYEEYFGSRIDVVDLSKTCEAVQIPHMVSLLKNNKLSNVSPEGRYYSNEEMLNLYFKGKKDNQSVKFPEWRVLCCDDEEFFFQLKENPNVKAAAEKFKDWEYPPYMHMIVGSFGEGVNIDAVTKAIMKAADKQDVIGKDVLSLILDCSKSQEDFIFMLDKAPDIAPKLRAKGFDYIQIYQTLSHLSRENYNYIKELWE